MLANSFVAENSVALAMIAIAIFLGVTVFRIAWRRGRHWVICLLFAVLPIALVFICFPYGALVAGVLVGKIYMSYG